MIGDVRREGARSASAPSQHPGTRTRACAGRHARSQPRETDVGSTGHRAGGVLPVAGPGHAVAHPALVDDQGRAVGLVGELVAQPLDVGAHDLGIGGGAPGPDPAQQAPGPPSPEINR